MKKSLAAEQITPFKRAAFRIGAAALSGGRAGRLLDEVLAKVSGGAGGGSTDPSACTEFTCNLYAPPPPAK